MTPKKISVKDERYLNIQWEDDSISLISLAVLRKNCPCANCIAERQSKPESYIPLYSSVQTSLSDIKVIGTYAVQLFWKDGHNTGIYTYDKLKKWK
jgi:DUF971 family protein